jgi:hypothetical protein
MCEHTVAGVDTASKLLVPVVPPEGAIVGVGVGEPTVGCGVLQNRSGCDAIWSGDPLSLINVLTQAVTQ